MAVDCSSDGKNLDCVPPLVTNESNTVARCTEAGALLVHSVGDFSGQPLDVGGKDESSLPDIVEGQRNSCSSPLPEDGGMLDTLATVESEERFHAEISRWEEFYDQMKKFLLQDNKANFRVNKNILKVAKHYSLGEDGSMYYSKLAKDGASLVHLLVVRDHSDRIQICRNIHLDTGHEHLHNRRDKMLDLVGRKYFWKGQRRDICQCIASCEVCSTGLGARRKTKPPAQKRDVPHGGPPQRKKAKVEKTKLSASNGGRSKQSKVRTSVPIPEGSHGYGVDAAEVAADCFQQSVGEKLQSFLADGIQARSQEWVQLLQPVLLSTGKEGVDHVERHFSDCRDENERGTLSGESIGDIPVLYVGPAQGGEGLKEALPDTDREGCSDQAASSVVDAEELSDNSPASDSKSDTENVSIYSLLFNLHSTPSDMNPSVVEAVHLGMKETVDVTSCFEVFDNLMLQIFSLGPEYSVMVAPCPASAYCVAIFSSLIALDPLVVTSQVSSRDLPFAVVHDAYCSHYQKNSMSSPELGMLKTGTSLTGCYNWNLGDTSHPMDREALTMALLSNRVASVLYQPYCYGPKEKFLSLKEMSGICHTQNSSVSLIVDGTSIHVHPHSSSVGSVVMSEMKGLLQQGADVVLMPPLIELGGVSRSCVLVGSVALLECARENMAVLQKQVCLPLYCQPHDLVDTIVTYKAMQHS